MHFWATTKWSNQSHLWTPRAHRGRGRWLHVVFVTIGRSGVTLLCQVHLVRTVPSMALNVSRELGKRPSTKASPFVTGLWLTYITDRTAVTGLKSRPSVALAALKNISDDSGSYLNLTSPATHSNHSDSLPTSSETAPGGSHSASHYGLFRSHVSHYEDESLDSTEDMSPGTPLYGMPSDSPLRWGKRYSVLNYAVGDPRGVTLVADICEPDRKNKSGHFLIRNTINASPAPEDLDYLRIKGVFSLPAAPICDALIRAYFHYVHPFLPIIDVGSFLCMYESDEREKVGVHLLWSMFLAATHVSWTYFSIHIYMTEDTNSSSSWAMIALVSPGSHLGRTWNGQCTRKPRWTLFNWLLYLMAN